jgi:holo-[acyl-carrier protein] synthase
MHLVAHGLDLVACKRIEQALREHGDRLLDRLLTDTEKRYVAGKRDPVPHLAGCWTDVEILNDAAGQPTCKLTGQVARVAAKLGIERMLISITHTDDFAAATALALGPAESR